MKNLFRFAFLSLFIVISACVTNDDEDVITDLAGTWKMTSFSSENAYDLNGDGVANTDVIVESGCYQNETLDFNANGTGVATSRSFLDIETEIVIGTTNEVTYTLECIDDIAIENFTWSQSGSSLTLTVDTITVVATLSGNTISFVIPEGFSVQGFDSGGNSVLIEITENVTVVYTKQ